MTTLKTAMVLGSTGLVGHHLTQQLIDDARYQAITLLVRRPLANTEFDDPLGKLQPIVIEFDALQDYQGYFSVDHVYCCLGTTLKKAGSQSAFRRVDFEFVHVAAQLARAQRADGFVWISSIGADAKSKNFYLRVKGELENALMTMPQLNHAAAVRPALLLGERPEQRAAESLGIFVSKLLSPIMIGDLKKYRPIAARQVAQQMIGLQHF